MRIRPRVVAVGIAVALAFAGWAPSALADFPFLGDGTLSNPSSWKLAPGETVTNLGGGLTQHFGATPATPPSPMSDPTGNQAVTQLNSQTDELCGVMGMSITDPHATMPAGTGSCIAAGTSLHTAFPDDARAPRRHDRRARLGDRLERTQRHVPAAQEGPAEPRRAAGSQGRPRVQLRRLDRRHLLLGARHQRRQLRPPRRHAGRRPRRQRRDPLRRDRTGGLRRARLRVRLARRQRGQQRSAVLQRDPREHLPQRAAGDADARGPDHRLLRRHRPRPQRLRQRHRRLELRRQQQRPLRRGPLRPRHRGAGGLERRGQQRHQRFGHVPQLRGAAAARRGVLRRRRQPLRRGRQLRHRPWHRRDPGATGHLQRAAVRAPGDRLRL